MRKWLQSHERRKEDRHGSEMALRKEQKRRRKELELDRIISSYMEG